jgi:hypothetical protein
MRVKLLGCKVKLLIAKNGVSNLTARPTAPSPKIATVDPFSTSATFHKKIQEDTRRYKYKAITK